jgi:hypothetical protein
VRANRARSARQSPKIGNSELEPVGENHGEKQTLVCVT